MLISHLTDKSICILGYGREGQSTHQWLIDNNITNHITIADDQKLSTTHILPRRGGDEHSESEGSFIIHDEGQRTDHLEDYDIIIRTAGYPIRTLQSVISSSGEGGRKGEVTSQTHIFFDNYEGATIAITGTKGKSTTATLIHHILQTAGHTTQLVGNIGTPVLSEIDLFDQSTNPDYIVYELSSFQLTNARIDPTYALITNLLEDHLDRHGSRDHYYHAKLNIIGPQTQVFAHATTVDQLTAYSLQLDAIYAGSGTEYDFDSTMFAAPDRHYPTDIQLPGNHNRENICLINALCHHLHITPDHIYHTIRDFGGLPHRMQLISQKGGIRRIDDSQSTNPSTCITAIQTYGDQIDTLLLGGYESHFDYAALANIINQSPIQHIILFPDTIQSFRSVLDETTHGYTLHDVTSMSEAVVIAADHTRLGQICLLSPAAKSFSLWTSMSERGKDFQLCVENHLR